MNKWQKLVQQQFLNNEEAVIGRLEDIYGKAQEDIEKKLNKLTFTIEKLQAEYDWLDPTDPEKARIKSIIQSKIYQKGYQEQLKKQVDGILGQMQVSQFTTISDYLDECYNDGFIGTIFDQHGQGVPITTPINQAAMVRAVQLDSKISKGLYTKLGEDVALLKKKITAEVSRSISTGKTFKETAQQLANQSRIGYNNAIRIARTEGHRIQTTATKDCMIAAKEQGADIVKQWDATLDGGTRETHVAVDGQIRELDEPFSNGLDRPGDPSGAAAEVINCRCALLQRARWAVDGKDKSFTKFNNFTKQIESFDSPEKYSDFKKAFFSKENKQYMNYVEDMQEKYGTKDFKKVLSSMSDREYKHYSKLLADNPIYNKKAKAAAAKPVKPTFTPAKTKEEALQYMERFVNQNKTKYTGIVDLGATDISVINDINEALTEVFEVYDAPPLRNILVMNMREKRWREMQAEAAYGILSGELYINGKFYKNVKTIAAHLKEYTELLERVTPKVPDVIKSLVGKNDYSSRKKLAYWEAFMKTGRTNVFGVDTKGTIIHEMGHMLDSEVFKLHNTKSTFDVKTSMEKYAEGISAYATSDSHEYIAESFAAFWKGETGILDPELVKIFEGMKKK